MCRKLLYLFFRTLRLVILLAYLVVNFQPIIKYIAFKINEEYIVENVCVEKDATVNTCQGSCYLSQEISDASNKPTESATQIKLRASELNFEFLIPNKLLPNKFGDNLKRSNDYCQKLISKNYKPLVPPPKYYS